MSIAPATSSRPDWDGEILSCVVGRSEKRDEKVCNTGIVTVTYTTETPMKSCRQIQAALPAYQDGAVEPAVEAAIVAHLGQCKACRWALAALNRVDLDLREALSPLDPPSTLVVDTMASIEATSMQRRVLPLIPWRGVGAAAAALALALALWGGIGAWRRPAALPAAPMRTEVIEPVQVARTASRGVLEVEPRPGVQVGAPFVVTSQGLQPYTGGTSVRMQRGRDGSVELVVDAFPSQG